MAKYQERPRQIDYCDVNEDGGAVHRCLHAIMHLIEDHAKAAQIPVRFAAAKLAEGDTLILEALKLDQNEKEMLEHIVKQMETERGLDRAAAIAICDLISLRMSVMRQWSNHGRVKNICEV